MITCDGYICNSEGMTAAIGDEIQLSYNIKMTLPEKGIITGINMSDDGNVLVVDKTTYIPFKHVDDFRVLNWNDIRKETSGGMSALLGAANASSTQGSWDTPEDPNEVAKREGFNDVHYEEKSYADMNWSIGDINKAEEYMEEAEPYVRNKDYKGAHAWYCMAVAHALHIVFCIKQIPHSDGDVMYLFRKCSKELKQEFGYETFKTLYYMDPMYAIGGMKSTAERIISKVKEMEIKGM